MKNLIIIISLIFLISFTAIIKTSSKNIEKEIFFLNENLTLLKEKYDMISFEYIYLSQPSRLIEIMKNKNEEYINLDKSNLKFLPND